jgi:hypothetical protein
MLDVAAHARTITAAFAVASFVFSSPVVAHTTVKAQATEGVRDDNAFKIGHACEELPVRVQSVVFPTDAPELTASDPGTTVASLSEVIEQGSLAGLVRPIQDGSIFRVQGVKTDANGNAIGMFGARGRLDPDLRGRVPFEFTSPSFVPDSCATRLLIEIAIADVCRPKGGRIEAGHLNLWIPDNGSRFAIEGAAAGVDGVGGPATLIVNRNLASNPIDTSCGGGFSLTVTPSAEQIDRDLPIPRYWPARRSP